MRLIDADALKREITDSGEDSTIANYVRHVLRETLDNVPTIDAVPVVRCGSCRHYNTACCSEGCGWCENRNVGTWDEWFCADGEAGTYEDD